MLLVVGAKRDIDSAFARCRLHPDGAAMFGTEFELSKDMGDAISCFYLVLPFGFTGPTGIFGRIMQAVQVYHQKSPTLLPSGVVLKLFRLTSSLTQECSTRWG